MITDARVAASSRAGRSRSFSSSRRTRRTRRAPAASAEAPRREQTQGEPVRRGEREGQERDRGQQQRRDHEGQGLGQAAYREDRGAAPEAESREVESACREEGADGRGEISLGGPLREPREGKLAGARWGEEGGALGRSGYQGRVRPSKAAVLEQ